MLIINIYSLNMKKIISFLFIIYSLAIYSQCGLSVNSNLGYEVNIEVEPLSIINSNWNSPNCDNGYTFSTELNINVSFTGNNIPAQISTLRGVLHCKNNNNSYHTFNIPNEPTNNHIEITNGEWRGMSDCSTATPSSLGCDNIDIIIDFDGSSEQTILTPCDITLPVELIYFNGQIKNKNSIILNWATSTEKNNDYFIIQKTTNLENWNEISRISSIGNSKQPIKYNFVDVDPVIGENYYRIIQVDIDGKTDEYLPIIINFNMEKEYKIYPTESSSTVYIEGVNIYKQKISIYNSQGVTIDSKSFVSDLNKTKKVINISNFEKGVYLIRIENQTYKFFKL